MIIAKTLLVLLELILSSFFSGYLASRKLLKRKLGLLECICEGFVWILGYFFVLALPFLIFQFPFHILSNLFWISSLLVVIYGERVLISKKDVKIVFNLNWRAVLVLFIILAQIIYSTYMYHGDDDDGYYIAISNLAVEDDLIETDANIVYNGIYREELGTGFAPPIVSWELFIACIAKLNNIHPAILAHSILPIWLIAISYISAWRIALAVFRGNNQVKNSMIFLMLYALLNLFGGFLVRQPACFLLLRIWQGKAVLANVIFPLVIENCLQIYYGNRKGAWLKSSMLMLAGSMLSSVGLVLTLFCYISYGLPYILYLVFKKRDELKDTLLKAVFSIMPTMILGMVSFLYVISQKAGMEYSTRGAERWWVWLQVTMGTVKNGYLVLGIIALIIILLTGKKEEKICIVGGTIVSLLTFLNPVFSKLISQKIIGVGVYWRIWWIIPLYCIIAIAFVNVFHLCIHYLPKIMMVCAVLGIVIFKGRFMYSPNLYFKEYQNIYQIPNEVLSVCDFLLKKDKYVSILVPNDMTRKVRQYSTKLYIPIAKYMIDSKVIIPGTKLTYGEVYSSIYNDNNISEEIYNALKNLDVKYIVTREKLVGGVI